MVASGLSSALPVASGLSAGAGLPADARPLANAGLGPASAPTVGELDGVLSAGEVPDVVVGVDAELDGVVGVIDVLVELGGVLLDDELVDGDEPGGDVDAVGEQLGVVDPVDPPLLPCPAGAVVPPPLVPV